MGMTIVKDIDSILYRSSGLIIWHFNASRKCTGLNGCSIKK